MDGKLIKTAFVRTIPVLTGYLVLGIGFGILLQKAGYGVLWAFFTSLLVFAGSMQYVLIGLLTSGAGFAATALMTLMVNARHLFYGISMIDKYKPIKGIKKPYLIFSLTDETYSLVVSGNEPEGYPKENYYLLVSAMDHCWWITGSVIGSLLGQALPFNSNGIEFAMTALFVTVFVEQWLSNPQHLPAVTGVAATAVCLLVFGSGSFLIPSMILITLILTLCRSRLEGKEDSAHE